jgi:hypothetical protein
MASDRIANPPMRNSLRCAAIAAVVLAATCPVCPVFAASTISALKARTIPQLATSGQQIVVLLFTATDCPISNRYIPEIDRIGHEFSGQGVAIYWVFSNPGDTLAVVTQHALQFKSDAPILIDSAQDLVHQAHVRVAPEAAVFAQQDGQFREVYHGRIDNRYISFGHQRPAATVHDLENAIQDVLRHHSVRQADGGPVGCSLVPRELAPRELVAKP